MDLLAIDINRGRDVGVPPYHAYYKLCLGIQIKSWNDLSPYFSNENLHTLRSTYKSVFDIDLLVGVLLENKLETKFYGRIGRCLVAKQFYNLKHGDRYFYTFPNRPNPFTRGLHSLTSMFSNCLPVYCLFI